MSKDIMMLHVKDVSLQLTSQRPLEPGIVVAGNFILDVVGPVVSVTVGLVRPTYQGTFQDVGIGTRGVVVAPVTRGADVSRAGSSQTMDEVLG